ncbi:MAG: extracellular solute-binding protein, partial [Waterburya sp.]
MLGSCNNQKQTSTSGVTEITFWHGINPPENRDIFQGLVDSFNLKNPDIKVKAIYIGQPDAQLPKILAATVSNQPPDILWFVAQIAGKLNQLGVLLPLDNWLNNSALKSEIDPAMFDSMELDEQILS